MKKLITSISVAALLASSFISAEAKKSTIEFVGSVSGFVKINSRSNRNKNSTVRIVVDRIDRDLVEDLESGDLLEAWLVDEGRASALNVVSSVDPIDASPEDEQPFGDTAVTPLGSTVLDTNGNPVAISNVSFINLVEAAPFAMTLGTLKKTKKGNYVGNFKVRSNFNSFDSLMITRERGSDPRPGGLVGEAKGL